MKTAANFLPVRMSASAGGGGPTGGAAGIVSSLETSLSLLMSVGDSEAGGDDVVAPIDEVRDE